MWRCVFLQVLTAPRGPTDHTYANDVMTRIDDLIDRMSGAKCFSSIDLASGYHQILIAPEDVPKTAFSTPFGHCQFKVLAFGLTNAPATFQYAMNQLFASQLGKYVCVCLDDILIFSKNAAEHEEHLKEASKYWNRINSMPSCQSVTSTDLSCFIWDILLALMASGWTLQE